MLKKVFWTGLFAGLLACGGVHAALLRITPSSQSVDVGNTVTVSLQISGLNNGVAPSLGVFDIDFGFDTALLSLSGALYGSGLDVLGLGSVQATTPGVGAVNLFELSLDSVADLNALQLDAFTLVTLSFNALASGFGPFTLTVNSLGDAEGLSIPVTVEGGSVTINAAVPEPATSALAALGLFALGIALRRKNG